MTKLKETVLIGVDFSCNKPSCCIYINGKYKFLTWPLEIDDKSINKLTEAGIKVRNRNRIPGKLENSSDKFRWHVDMADRLAKIIVSDIKESIVKTEDVYIAFEGSSFASKGDAGLQLAGYRYILTNELGKIYGGRNIYTYAPLTIKSVAGCATKDKKGKLCMINELAAQDIDHSFVKILRDDPQALKKKTNFVPTVDDLADGFWILQTLREKEQLN
jgi:hypothetical protein